MQSTDELLDAAAAEANRREMRRTIVITSICLGLVLVASLVAVLGGVSA